MLSSLRCEFLVLHVPLGDINLLDLRLNLSFNVIEMWVLVFWPDEDSYTVLDEGQLRSMIKKTLGSKTTDKDIPLNIGDHFKALWVDSKQQRECNGVVKKKSRVKRFLNQMCVEKSGTLLAPQRKADDDMVKARKKETLADAKECSVSQGNVQKAAENILVQKLKKNDSAQSLVKESAPSTSGTRQERDGCSPEELNIFCDCPQCPLNKMGGAIRKLSLAKSICKDAYMTMEEAFKAVMEVMPNNSLNLPSDVPWPDVWPWEKPGKGKVALLYKGENSGVYMNCEVLQRETQLNKSNPTRMARRLFKELFSAEHLATMSSTTIPRKAYTAVIRYVTENRDPESKFERLSKSLNNLCYKALPTQSVDTFTPPNSGSEQPDDIQTSCISSSNRKAYSKRSRLTHSKPESATEEESHGQVSALNDGDELSTNQKDKPCSTSHSEALDESSGGAIRATGAKEVDQLALVGRAGGKDQNDVPFSCTHNVTANSAVENSDGKNMTQQDGSVKSADNSVINKEQFSHETADNPSKKRKIDEGGQQDSAKPPQQKDAALASHCASGEGSVGKVNSDEFDLSKSSPAMQQAFIAFMKTQTNPPQNASPQPHPAPPFHQGIPPSPGYFHQQPHQSAPAYYQHCSPNRGMPWKGDEHHYGSRPEYISPSPRIQGEDQNGHTHEFHSYSPWSPDKYQDGPIRSSYHIL